MSVRPLLLLLAGCATGSAAGGVTTGMVMPLQSPPPGFARTVDAQPADGVELRAFASSGRADIAMPNTFGIAFRQIGDEHVQTASQVGWTIVADDRGPMLFGRLMFDLIASERTMDGDRKFSAFSPTLDLGISPWHNGLCLSASATWDVHFNAPDRAIVGAFIGFCGAAKR